MSEHKPTLGEAMAQAIRERDGVKAGRLVDVLRFKYGQRYDDCLEFARNVWRKHGDGSELTDTDWETLMYQADMES